MCHRHAHSKWGRHARAHWKRDFRKHFHRPPADISEKEEHFELLLFAPGVDKNGITIRVKNDELFIKYQAPKEEDEIVSDFMEPEYAHASFVRTFRLNNKALVEDISATYADGVLKVILPKNPETNRPVHEVEVG